MRGKDIFLLFIHSLSFLRHLASLSSLRFRNSLSCISHHGHREINKRNHTKTIPFSSQVEIKGILVSLCGRSEGLDFDWLWVWVLWWVSIPTWGHCIFGGWTQVLAWVSLYFGGLAWGVVFGFVLPAWGLWASPSLVSASQITCNDSQFSCNFQLVACENLIFASLEINKPNSASIGFIGFNLKANGLYKVLVNK